MLVRFFRHTNGVAPVDYLFAVALAYGVEWLSLGHGRVEGLVVRRLLGLG